MKNVLLIVMFFALVSCQKQDVNEIGGVSVSDNNPYVTAAEKGKPVNSNGCGIVATNDGSIPIDLIASDCSNASLNCGMIESTFRKNIRLRYTETVKFTLDYVATSPTIIVDIAFVERDGTITYPSRLRQAIWRSDCSYVDGAIGFDAPLEGLTIGGLHRIGISASPCNLNGCKPVAIVITVRPDGRASS